MADDEVLKINLDVKEFVDNATKAKEAISAIEDPASAVEFLANFKSMVPVLAGIGVAAAAVGVIMNEVFEAENIQSVNEQFDMLTKNAGLSGDALKDAMTKASGGLISENDLLKITNKGIVELGDNANRLPEIMELARKATAVFGGDLMSNFQNIDKSLASGNTRMLKQYGIIVDTTKAETDYGKSIGKLNQELTDNDKKTAVLNASLQKGQEIFAGVNADIKVNTNLWQQFKATMTEVGETVALIFDKVFGKTLAKVLAGTKNAFQDLNLFLKSSFGDGAEKADADLQRSERSIASLQARLKKLNDDKVHGFFDAFTEQDIQQTTKKLEELTAKVKAAKSEAGSGGALVTRQGASPASIERKPYDDAKSQEAKAKLAKDLADVRLQRINSEMAIATDQDKLDQLTAEKEKTLNDQKTAALSMLDAKQKLNQIDEKTAAQQKIQIESETQAKVTQLRREAVDNDIKALNQLALAQKNTSAAFATGFKIASVEAGKSLKDFSALGQSANKALVNSMASGFLAISQGGAAAADALKKAAVGAIADEAESRGRLALAASIWPPNPLGLAAGAGLIALAGLLRSSVGDGGGSSAGAGASGGGGTYGATVSDISTGDYRQGLTQSPAPVAQRSVTVAVQGNYFETDQTRQTLMNMIRQETDATDFKYVQIGGS